MLRYRLIALIYLLALAPATLLAGNPDGRGHFYWNTFWQFELIAPTIVAVLILAIAWVANPNPTKSQTTGSVYVYWPMTGRILFDRQRRNHYRLSEQEQRTFRY